MPNIGARASWGIGVLPKVGFPYLVRCPTSLSTTRQRRRLSGLQLPRMVTERKRSRHAKHGGRKALPHPSDPSHEQYLIEAIALFVSSQGSSAGNFGCSAGP